MIDISIHALLAESDRAKSGQQRSRNNFYPRSPCGERPIGHPFVMSSSGFLSTLSLRRATKQPGKTHKLDIFLSTLSLRRATAADHAQDILTAHFYPRSPCGERHHGHGLQKQVLAISIHALLAESDTPARILSRLSLISIHALLAESDNKISTISITREDFYPRSPCGERQVWVCLVGFAFLFLSTLSLRRATSTSDKLFMPSHYFYPRSPCGERPHPVGILVRIVEISIHALLAESDHNVCRDFAA